MKKLMMAVAAVAAALWGNAAALVSGGKPVAVVTTEGATKNAQLNYAARELTNWVAHLTGAALPVVDAADAERTTIYLGTPRTSPAVAAFAKRHADDFRRFEGNDGFVIAEEGGFLGFGKKAVYIAAGRTKGVLNGVYRFLEKNSDIIWASPLEPETSGTVYTKSPDFANAVDRFVDVPAIGEARFWAYDAWSTRLLCKRFPQKPSKYSTPEMDAIGDPDILQMSFPLGIIDKYKESDPDIFPLLENGKRATGEDHQLCFMNPKSLDLFAKEASKMLEGMPHEIKYMDIGLGDNWSLCTCKEWCMKEIKLPDGRVVKPTDRNFRSTQYTLFVNALSDRLKKDHPWAPDLFVGCYVWTAEAPAVPCKGGTWLYCPYVKNHKKPVYDDTINASWHRRAEEFKAAGMPFRGLYEYYLCTTTPKFYNAVCEVAAKDLQYYLPDLKQCYLDAGNHPDCFDMSAIEYWTMSRVMWNPHADVKGIRHEYCRRAYREATDIMTGYFDRLAENYNSDPAGCYWNDVPESGAKHYIGEKGLAGWVRETLAKAVEAAKHPAAKKLIERHRAVMEKYVSIAEKMPKRVELIVPQILEKPTLDETSAYWRRAGKVEPITKMSKADVVLGDKRATVKMAHDRHNLYVLAVCHSERYRKRLTEELAKGKPGPDAAFQWETPFEFYLDGDLAPKGSYHFFAAMYNGLKYTGNGPTKDPKNPPWTIEYGLVDDGIKFLMTFPFDSVGIDISKGNRVGCMFLGPDCSWNGGQWHSPTSFQSLLLEMK